jgi:hypoxanthine phosphoribosyltransferase
MESKKFIWYGWIAFERDAEKLATKIMAIGKPRNIYGKPRGGLCLAVKLSHLLNVPMIYEESQIGPDTQIVEDTCDTGATLYRLARLTKRPVMAIFANNATRQIEVPGLIYLEETDGGWVIFPWEVDEDDPKVKKLRRGNAVPAEEVSAGGSETPTP